MRIIHLDSPPEKDGNVSIADGTEAIVYDIYPTNTEKGSAKIVKLFESTPQAQKRNTILTYAQEHDKEYAEKVRSRLTTIQNLHTDGILSDSPAGVAIEGYCMLASTATHNQIIEEHFSGQTQAPFTWQDHGGSLSHLHTVRKDDLDTKLQKEHSLSETWELVTKKFLVGTIFPWIDAHFEGVSTDEHRLYILQLINPDLFACLFFAGSSDYGSFRHALFLGVKMSQREFAKAWADSDRAALFLMKKI